MDRTVSQSQPEYLEVIRRVRPPRIATLIPDSTNWHEDVISLFNIYSRTWGGLGDIIVPYSQDGTIHEAIFNGLREYDADYFVGQGGWSFPDTVNNKILENLSPFLDRYDDTSWRSSLLHQDEYLITDMCKLSNQSSYLMNIELVDMPLPLQVLIRSITGGISDAHRKSFPKEIYVLKDIKVGIQDLETSLRFVFFNVMPQIWTQEIDNLRLRETIYASIHGTVPPKIFGQLALSMTAHGCKWYSDNILHPMNPMLLVIGDSFNDFAYALLMNRLGHFASWIPVNVSNSLPDINDKYLTALRNIFREFIFGTASVKKVVCTSLSLTEIEVLDQINLLYETDQRSSCVIEYSDPLAVEPSKLQFLLDDKFFQVESRQPFLDGTLLGEIPPLTPNFVEDKILDDCIWILDVVASSEDGNGYRLPTRSILNKLADSKASIVNQVRVSSTGVSYRSHLLRALPIGTPLMQRLVRPSIRLPSADEVFQELAKRHNLKLHLSANGRYNQITVALWGGLDKLAADLLNKTSRNLFDKWIVGKNNPNYQDPTPGFIPHDRRFFNLCDAVEATQATAEEIRELFDRYLTRSIIRRGLVLRCCRCLYTTFYPIDDFGHSFACSRCESNNLLNKNSWHKDHLEPIWFYELDEVVYQTLHLNGLVPLLALQRLSQDAKSFSFMHESEVTGGNTQIMEVDLWAIKNGEIILGEAKSNNVLSNGKKEEEKQCARLAEVSEKFTADKFVLATSSTSWDDRTIKTMTEKLERSRIQLVPLAGIGLIK